jgi:hypothetical protein
MKEDYSNLRGKTVFDFTRDKDILKDILTETDFEEYLENKEELIEESKDWTEMARARCIISFAKITANAKMYEMLEHEFKEEYPQFFWKPGEMWPN